MHGQTLMAAVKPDPGCRPGSGTTIQPNQALYTTVCCCLCSSTLMHCPGRNGWTAHTAAPVPAIPSQRAVYHCLLPVLKHMPALLRRKWLDSTPSSTCPSHPQPESYVPLLAAQACMLILCRRQWLDSARGSTCPNRLLPQSCVWLLPVLKHMPALPRRQWLDSAHGSSSREGAEVLAQNATEEAVAAEKMNVRRVGALENLQCLDDNLEASPPKQDRSVPGQIRMAAGSDSGAVG